MGTGYTTIMYGAESIDDAMSDIAACRYNGVEIGVEKVREAGPKNIDQWLDDYDLDLYCVMSEWMESEEAVKRMVEDAPMIADLDAECIGILPPQRGRHNTETVENWLKRVTEAAIDAGVQPLVHHHGATAVERPEEIRHYLDAIDGMDLLLDTAHYYPYSEHFPDGDLTDAIERFADDIDYIHLKDIDPVKDFAANRDALSQGDFHLDNVINYFRSFTDLGEGVIDFESVYQALSTAGYDGHYTIEIENQTERSLVHAKQNYDYWTDITSA